MYILKSNLTNSKKKLFDEIQIYVLKLLSFKNK